MWLITGPVEVKFKRSKWPLNSNVRLHVDEMATNDIRWVKNIERAGPALQNVKQPCLKFRLVTYVTPSPPPMRASDRCKLILFFKLVNKIQMVVYNFQL